MPFRGLGGASDLGNWVRGFSVMEAATTNLEYLRQLIAESRNADPQADADRLRMLHGYGVGTDQMTQKNGER